MVARSTTYPAISLDKAVQRAKQIHDRVQRGEVNVKVVSTYWDYKGYNGKVTSTLGAMRQFGLIEVVSGTGEDRNIRLTQLGVEVAALPEPGRANAIRTAALAPSLHKAMQEKYPAGQWDDDQVEFDLVSSGNFVFTPNGALEFIKEYKRTMEFAGLNELTVEQVQEPFEEDSSESEEEEVDSGVPVASSASVINNMSSDHEIIPLYIRPGVIYELKVVLPMSESDWEKMRTLLEAHKTDLVD